MKITARTISFQHFHGFSRTSLAFKVLGMCFGETKLGLNFEERSRLVESMKENPQSSKCTRKVIREQIMKR